MRKINQVKRQYYGDLHAQNDRDYKKAEGKNCKRTIIAQEDKR